jgi:hypothetical protein
MARYAGLDWSGTPYWRHMGDGPNHYLPCAVRVENVDDLESAFASMRSGLGLPMDFEFRGYKSSPRQIIRVLEYVLEHATIVSLVFDKQTLAQDLGAQIFDKPAMLPIITGQIVINQMLQTGPLGKLWCDKGDIATNRQGLFNTAIMRVARSLWPEGVRIAHVPSGKSQMIQCADIVAYVLHREVQGLSETKEISRQAQKLWRKDGNIIRWGNGDDLRPYL